METQDDRRIPVTPGLQTVDTNFFVQCTGEQNDNRNLNNTSFLEGAEPSQDTLLNTFMSNLENTVDVSMISPTLIRELLARFQQQQQLINMLLEQQQSQSSAASTTQQDQHSKKTRCSSGYYSSYYWITRSGRASTIHSGPYLKTP
jgi:hypothetical protein